MNIKSINNIELTNIKSYNNVLVKNIHSVNNILQNYAFNLDLTTFKDTVTGRSLSCNIDGTRYDEVDGVTTAFTTDVPTIADNGLRICGTYSNLGVGSVSFAGFVALLSTLNTVEIPSPLASTYKELLINNNSGTCFMYKLISLTDNTEYLYTLYVKKKDAQWIAIEAKQKNDSLAYSYINLDTNTSHSTTAIKTSIKVISNNWIIVSILFNASSGVKSPQLRLFIAEKDNDKTFDTPSTLGCYCAGYQLLQKKYYHPYIPTTTSEVSSPSEAGNSSTGTGIWIDDVASNFPLLNTALTNQGTLTFKWKTGFNDADVSGNLNILSFDGTTNSISYDADNNLIKITDGTNTASKALTVVADTEYTIQATWGLVSGSPKMAIAVDGTAGTQSDFTGTFNPSDIYFGLGNEELQYVKDMIVYKVATWL